MTSNNQTILPSVTMNQPSSLSDNNCSQLLTQDNSICPQLKSKGMSYIEQTQLHIEGQTRPNISSVPTTISNKLNVNLFPDKLSSNPKKKQKLIKESLICHRNILEHLKTTHSLNIMIVFHLHNYLQMIVILLLTLI